MKPSRKAKKKDRRQPSILDWHECKGQIIHALSGVEKAVHCPSHACSIVPRESTADPTSLQHHKVEKVSIATAPCSDM